MEDKNNKINLFEHINESTTSYDFLKSISASIPFKLVGYVEVSEDLPSTVDSNFLFYNGVEADNAQFTLTNSVVEWLRNTILTPDNFLINKTGLDNHEIINQKEIQFFSRIPIYLDCNTIIGIIYFAHDSELRESKESLFPLLSTIGSTFSKIYFREYGCELPGRYSEVNLLKKMLNSNHDLISSVIHDLSNPLTIIYFEAQKALANLDKDHTKSLENIEISIDLIYKIIDSTKKFFSKNKDKEELETIIVKDVIDFISLQYGDLLNEKNLTVESDGLEYKFIAYRNTFLNTVIGSLVSNSIRYSKSNGSIKVYGREVDKVTEIIIEDQAGGFPIEVLENLESNFKSKPSPSTDGEIGSGMGLILAKSYLQVMNGRLEIESLKQGSRIILKMSK